MPGSREEVVGWTGGGHGKGLGGVMGRWKKTKTWRASQFSEITY